MSAHAIIAGTGPGLGLAIARRFAAEGFRVSLLARNPVAHAAAIGPAATACPVDLTDFAATSATIAQAVAERGPADVLVCNAARWHEEGAMAIAPEAFHAELALAVTGALAAAQAVHPGMKAAGRGTMLFTGGGLALHPQAGGAVPALTAGKAALRALVLAMAPGLAGEGIHAATVTVAGQIAPGTAFDPDRIAAEYWALHRQPRADWEVERVFRGAA